MTRPTDQQLQEELAQVVQKHNDAQKVSRSVQNQVYADPGNPTRQTGRI